MLRIDSSSSRIQSNHMHPYFFPEKKRTVANFYFEDEREKVVPGATNIGDQEVHQEAGQYRANRVEETSLGQPLPSFSLMQRDTSKSNGTSTDWVNTLALDKSAPPTFPQQLFDVLSNESLSDIITWLPHGQGWIIRDKQRFSVEVLPKYFEKRSKWTSFTRKLNRWNFTRVTRGEEVGAYYHNLFRKGRKDLCMQMMCMGSKVPQSLEPLNPVALGLATPNMVEQGLLSTITLDNSGDQSKNDFQQHPSIGTSRREHSTVSQHDLGEVHSLLKASQVSNPMAPVSLPNVAHNQYLQDMILPIASSVPSQEFSMDFGQQEEQQSSFNRVGNQQQLEEMDLGAFSTLANFRQQPSSHNPLAFPSMQQEHDHSNWDNQHPQVSSSESSLGGGAGDRMMMEMYAKVVAEQGGSFVPSRSFNRNTQSNVPHRDTLTLTPTRGFARYDVVGGVTHHHHLPASSSGGDDTEVPHDEDQNVSPSIFDYSGSDQSSEDGPSVLEGASTLMPQTGPAQLQPKSTGTHHKPHNHHSASHGIESREHNKNNTGESTDAMHHLRRNYFEAIMLLEQKNGLQNNPSEPQYRPEE
mmetsp:Transcript_11171/g.30613  ORF Transcript_11171/g.30613 Transcript_11171/m.30613 type:complete len:581 (+) Transcript_11171:72-1814(+)